MSHLHAATTVPINTLASELSMHMSDANSQHQLTGTTAALPLSAAPGLDALYSVCSQVYPDQPNPLQVTAFIKYWLVYVLKLKHGLIDLIRLRLTNTSTIPRISEISVT